jgi:AAA family ATP:ADP antiporter
MNQRSPLERLLAIFTDVKAGEGTTALLLTLNIFLILTAYYIIKPVREALILSVEGGAASKIYTAAGQSLLLLGAIPLYARLASRVSRRRLINWVTVFFVSNLVLFFVAVTLVHDSSLALGVGFFLWVGVFNVMVPAQFWSFANDIYTVEQGKRLFAIVAFGASSGAVVGSWITRQNIEQLGLGNLLLMSGGLLLVALGITAIVENLQSGRARAEAAPEQEPLPEGNAFSLVWRSRYLLFIAFLMLILNWVNSTGEYILSDMVKTAIEKQADSNGLVGEARSEWVGESIGGFYASFFGVVNVVALLMQLFLVSRIIKYIGVRIALLILPCIALGGYALLFAIPLLGVVRWAKTAENATDYSLQNTVRQALFLPTTREEKYKAKQVIDTFFMRAGDVAAAVVVGVGVQFLGLSGRQFALVNLGLVVVWLFLAIRIGREYQKLTAD